MKTYFLNDDKNFALYLGDSLELMKKLPEVYDDLKAELDKMVYKLYNLTLGEIGVVENSSKK